ncbi:MAG: hypothetical protein DMD72_01185 [Gemmatimonadetes bacterium]|nr:MAG: hypothetical protein DMD72_01185 [Gemmatimonadota bacterium]
MAASHRTWLVSLIVVFAVPAVAGGQLPQQSLQVEGRLDGIFARTAGVEAGLGITIPAGIYVRSGLLAGLGAGRHAGGGISGRYRSELDGGARAYLLIFLGVEGPLPLGEMAGWVPAFELGLGGGARVGIVLRQGINARR